MLVLSRHKDETIEIEGGILVTVVDIRGDKVRLGFAAPRNITIDRWEVAEAKRREAKQREEERLADEAQRDS